MCDWCSLGCAQTCYDLHRKPEAPNTAKRACETVFNLQSRENNQLLLRHIMLLAACLQHINAPIFCLFFEFHSLPQRFAKLQNMVRLKSATRHVQASMCGR